MNVNSSAGRYTGRQRASRWLRLMALAPVVAILLMWTGPARGANASTTTKPYAANVTGPDPLHPHDVAAGASAAFTFTLTNEASPQQLGSANVTPPSGFTVIGVTPSTTVIGNVVHLRNLALQPGQSTSVTIQVNVPCTSGTYIWQTQAKQANDFQGPSGNDFTLDTSASSLMTTVGGNCHLNFLSQPTDAQVNATITAQPFNTPPGGPVQVEVLDGNNARITSSTGAITLQIGPTSPNSAAGATLSGAGSVTQNATAGLASFATLSINLHGAYNLLATSPGIISTTSAVFDIWDSVATCQPGQQCTDTVSNTDSQTSQVTGTSATTGFLLASLGQDALSCGDTFNHAPGVTTVSELNFSSSAPKTVVVTIAKQVVQQTPNNGASFYAVCYSSPTPFTDVNGNIVTTGLLPKCKANALVAPCVKSITKDNAGEIVETVTVPSGDPFIW
jgi:hypothetical protein